MKKIKKLLGIGKPSKKENTGNPFLGETSGASSMYLKDSEDISEDGGSGKYSDENNKEEKKADICHINVSGAGNYVIVGEQATMAIKHDERDIHKENKEPDAPQIAKPWKCSKCHNGKCIVGSKVYSAC